MSVNRREALAEPVAAGVKVTCTVHELPAGTDVPEHPSSWSAKAVWLLPLSAAPLIDSAAFPVFFTVTVWPALAVPVVTGPNDRLVGLKVTAGAGGGGWERPHDAANVV